MKSSFSIVIPNFNGLKLLSKHLPFVIKHSRRAPIIIVDDASTDESVAWIQKHYPQIRIVVNPQNLGFARTVNRGIALARTDLILLLNNDVSLTTCTVPSLLPHFSDGQVFAVGCLELLARGSKRGKSIGRFHRGLLVHQAASNLDFGPTLWVFAASGMFRKSTWDRLGGLDPLYHPAYWEDIDLGYRAWKAGYTCLFEPKARVRHDAEVTMNRVFKTKKNIIVFKNQILFYWKNITSLSLIFSHLFWMPYHLFFTSLRSKGQFLAGFILALTQLFEVCSQKTNATDRLTDKQILSQLNS